MALVAATSFTGLLGLFAAVPLGIIAGIYGAEYAGALRRRPRGAKRP